jgi:hypothetical protein
MDLGEFINWANRSHSAIMLMTIFGCGDFNVDMIKHPSIIYPKST